LTENFELATLAPFSQVMFGAVGEAEEGDKMTLQNYNPIGEECRAAIERGIGPMGDPKYRAAYLNYRLLACPAK
jgi:hypothetical protein